MAGKINMRAFLSSSKVDGTVFEPLREPALFAEARGGYGCGPVAERR